MAYWPLMAYPYLHELKEEEDYAFMLMHAFMIQRLPLASHESKDA